jgi:hypothetical protein
MASNDFRRTISEPFEQQLIDGILAPVLRRVQKDDTLTMEIRNGYVDIYYRGGRLLGLEEQGGGNRFRAHFDRGYCDDPDYCRELPDSLPPIIEKVDDAVAWVDAFPVHKQAMDLHFHGAPKIEREYQQAVMRENNRHASGEASDYVIVDIEYTQSARGGHGERSRYRFDMVGFRWPAEGRRSRQSKEVTPVIMEMKVGDAAMRSRPKRKGDHELTPGLVKHVQDIEAFMAAPAGGISPACQKLRGELAESYEIKKRLGLPSLPEVATGSLIVTEEHMTAQPEVIFLLAAHNPKSKTLRDELRDLRAVPRRFARYRVAQIAFAGYALFDESMVELDDFIEVHG